MLSFLLMSLILGGMYILFAVVSYIFKRHKYKNMNEMIERMFGGHM